MRNMKRKLLLMFALVFPLALMIAKVEAYNPYYQIDAVSGLTPAIDGSVGVSEWIDASKVTFNNTVAYLKQDGKSLYAAFSVVDNTVDSSGDAVGVCIDRNNDGGNIGGDDFACAIFRNGTRMELQGNSTVPEWIGVLPSGWESAVTSNTTGWEAEFNITYSKIGITIGQAKTLGAALNSYEKQGYLNYYWPSNISGSEILNASNWGNLYSSPLWIPEFTLIFTLPLFMFATLLATVVYRRKQSI
jgi:hypothetical protein